MHDGMEYASVDREGKDVELCSFPHGPTPFQLALPVHLRSTWLLSVHVPCKLAGMA